MGWSDIIGGISPPTFPSDGNVATYAAYYSIAGVPVAPSGLTAAARSDARIDLAWTDNSSDESGFTIERSLDGINFSTLTTVGSNVTSYSNLGLAAGTTYTYRIYATNSTDNSAPSNIASATTASTLSVSTVTLSTVNAGGGKKKGQAVVLVVDNLGNPVTNATVTGQFTGSYNETGSAVTASNGNATIQTTTSKSGTVTFTFCVTQVTHPTLSTATSNVCASF